MRTLLPLATVSAFFLVGTSHAFSQSTSELLDRAQKDLQTRYDEKRPKSDDRDTARSSRDQAESYAMQNVLSELRQARRYFVSGNEETGIQQLSQFQSMSNVPEETKTAIEAVIQQAQKERAARDAAFAKEVDAACQRASEAVLKAKEPKDLDATLQDLAHVTDSQPGSRYNDGGNNRASTRLQAAVTFVNRWQDYLLALNRHNESGVANALRNLADNSNSREPSLVPRSVILALQPQTDPENESSSRSRRPGRPQAQIDADAVEIVQGVKTLDEVPAALAKLVALRKELTSQPSYSSSPDSDLNVALTSLQAIQKTLLELQNGLATSISLSSERSGYNPHPNVENALLPVRVQLLKLAAPRLLGAGSDEKPVAEEALDTYLRRLIDAAKKRQDWNAVVRGLELKHTLATSTTTGSYVASNDQEVTAFKSFFAGRNLEQAGQFEQAVISYLTALRSGQEDLPSAAIGEHLTAIQKAHPTEYTGGSAYVLNPPPSPYGDFPRFGLPGMYRGGFDPRSPGRPGFPGMPAVEEKLSVPAAPPTPSPVPPTPPTPGPKTSS